MGRFEPAAVRVEEDVTATGSELLDRLEAQAAEIARLTERHERVQEALSRERKMREDAAAWIEREHASLKKRKAEAEQEVAGVEVDSLRQELEDERKQSALLNRQLAQAWAEIQVFREKENSRSSMFRRR